MLTAMLAVDNIQGARHDLWQVNAEQEYHEETTSREADAKVQLGQLAATQPQVPQPMTPAARNPRLSKEVRKPHSASTPNAVTNNASTSSLRVGRAVTASRLTVRDPVLCRASVLTGPHRPSAQPGGPRANRW